MDNNAQPFTPQPSGRPINPDPQLPPAMDSQTPPDNQYSSATASGSNSTAPARDGFSQGQTASLNNQSGPAIHNTGVRLESPILGPTHFDGIKAPDMTGTIASSPAPVPQNQAESNAKLFKTLSIVFGALAFIGIILGIWSLVSNLSTSKQLATTQATLNNAVAIIRKVEADTGTAINSVDDVPAYTAIDDTIYIPEWGISFKIPEDLENVSYILDQKYRPQVCFAAHKTGIKYFPAFADIDQNPNGLGCVTRVATYEGDSDKDTGASFGQKIYTYGDYNYFYTAPEGHFSGDASEQGLEDTAVQIIKNMISNNISHY